MPSRLITQQSAFDALCRELADAGTVTFDTEFVSELYYQPRLCLLQFGTADRIEAVDPFKIDDLSAWWKLMIDDVTTVVVHGGREEVRYCLRFTGQRPRKLVDVQVAEGLLSRGFPLSYKALVQRVLGEKIDGSQTRTDWGHRPLTSNQVEYALEDVRYPLRIWEKQQKQLSKLGRLEWALDEFERRIDDYQAEDEREGWRRISGVQRLSRREMAIIREIHTLRNEEAARRDKPPRSILRDDLIIDLARRKPRTLKEVTATRGMERRDYRKLAEDLLAGVQRGLDLPDDECPARPASHRAEPQEDLLAKLLALALADRCAELGISSSIVGTMNDLTELVRWHTFEAGEGELPRLKQGWRAEVCGNVLTDLLDGRVTLRVADPHHEAPLRFEPFLVEGSRPPDE
jgi:ribonuclease D